MMDLALKKLIPDTHPDDRAATYSRASILYFELGEMEQSVEYGGIASDLWMVYSRLQFRMIEMFSKIAHKGLLE